MKSSFQACRVILTPNRINRKDRTPPFRGKHQAPSSIQRDTLALPSTTQTNLSGCHGDSVLNSTCFPQQKQKAISGCSSQGFQQPLHQALSHREHHEDEKKLRSEGHYRWGLWCPKEVESLYSWKKKDVKKQNLLSSFSTLGFSSNFSKKNPDFSFSVFSVCQMSSIFQVFLDRYNSPCTKWIPG